MKRNRLVIALLLCCMLALAGCNKEEQVSSSKKTEEQVNDVQKTEEKDVVTALMDENLSKKEEKTDSKQVKPENVVVNTQKDPETKDVISESDPQVPFDISHPEVIENGEVEYSDDTIMVKFSKAFDGTVDEELKKAGVAKLEVMFELENATWYTAYLNKSAKVEDTLTSVRAYSKTIVAEYNFAYETTSNTSVDEAFNGAVNGNQLKDKQKVFHSCHIKDAWKHCHDKKQVGGGSSSVVVAVIDTGVDYEHVDLKANMWKNQSEIDGNNKDDDGNGYVDDYYGIDITARKGSAMDDNGHGTHVAGIIGASNNKEGVVGIAYNTKIMPIKAGDASGYFLQDNIAKAIIYAYEHGADVINMSFGGSAASIAVQDALAVAYSRCVLIASAGNDGMPNEGTDNYLPSPNYPAALSYVIGVMSTDFNDVESSFTNWDTTLYNSVEYEVYAPGNQILSTIPGDKYAELSGTSMASPVVAAQAAILRSFYSDTDTYPTKFIYGQIVGTADEVVKCLNPEKHTVGGYPHNIPGRVNFIRSIEELPTPDIGMSDYTIFDTENYVADTKGVTTGQLESNNGDGRIDSGEVIALGFTLKNRWGMSKDTVVHIDSTTEAGMSHPYVTFLNNDINYESIGTYSQSDSGKLYSEDGQMWTGWENPFYIKIDKDCPNEYSITLNISITYKNGLDESDRTTYTTTEKILLTVRRGTILPNKISEDMTLTKDNYYIIPNSMIVMEGATLTIEEGTKVQFWCSDPEDAYADTAITYINVAGKLISKGTEEEPVEMFPSEWMGKYRVEIYTSGNGYASLEYTNVVNPYLTIDEAGNCEFTQNYSDLLYYRRLLDGNLRLDSGAGRVEIKKAFGCSFYKLGSRSGSNSLYPYKIFGLEYDTCTFVDCMVLVNGSNSDREPIFCNCVFYGNNIYQDTDKGGTSTFQLSQLKVSDNMETVQVFTNEETGKTYMVLKSENEYNIYTDEVDAFYAVYSRFAKKMGGQLYSIDSQQEFDWVNSKLSKDTYYYFGITQKSDGYYNYNSERIEDLSSIIAGDKSNGVLYNGKLLFEFWHTLEYYHLIVEIPGEVFVSDIQLEEYVVNIDTDTEYQINATVTAANAADTKLVYESEDENIVNVDENGVITPISQGSAQVRVYSSDRAVYNYITVNVIDVVIPENIETRENELLLNVGTSKEIKVDFSPVNATKRNLQYESSDESVVTVNKKGVVTAHSEGEAIITIKGYDGLTTQVKVKSRIFGEKMYFKNQTYMTTLEKDDSTDFYPVILPENTTNKKLVWESSNPEICYVDEKGKLIKLQKGSAILSASLEDSDLTAEVVVGVIDDEIQMNAIDVQICENNRYTFALTNEGRLWIWGNDIIVPYQLPVSNVVDFHVDSSGYYNDGSYDMYIYVLDNAGTIAKYKFNSSERVFYIYSKSILTNVKLIEGYDSNLYAILNDGTVWAWGDNQYGQLGNGTTTNSSSPTQMMIDKEIVKIVADSNSVVLLDNSKRVYKCGSYSYYKTPTLLAEQVHDIISTESFDFGDYVKHLDSNRIYEKVVSDEKYLKLEPYSGRVSSYYIADGEVYIQGSDNTYGQYAIGYTGTISDHQKMIGISNAIKVYQGIGCLYIQTEDGKLYVSGLNDKYQFGNATTINSCVPIEIPFGLTENHDKLEIENTNLETDDSATVLLRNGEVVVDFNEALIQGTAFPNIILKSSSGAMLGSTKTLNLDKLIIKPSAAFASGETYTLTIPAKAVTSKFGVANEKYEVTFQYVGPEAVEEEDEVAPEIHDTVVVQDIYKQRYPWSIDKINALWSEFVYKGYNTRFYNNVILNRLNDDEVSKWLRIQPNENGKYSTIDIGANYWGTTSMELVNKQILDFDDYQSLPDIVFNEILTEAPEDTFPFVVDAYLETNGERVDTVGNELVTFVVEFNRDMDTSIDLRVSFGSAYPYADYTVEGSYATPRQWRGTMKLSTIIENGYQYWSVSNGKAAGTSMKLYTDWGRFPFMIDTSSAQALTMQAEATEAGIKLTWQQDDFETLAGYNVYRSTKEDGQYTKINRTVIPADTMEWFDDTVEPGQLYYYNFTVIQTDMTESEPSGKVTVSAFDTMAPNIYHSPVYHAFTGSNLVISATVTDNVALEEVTLYYRTLGTEEWHSKTMTNNNDKYSAVISSDYITVAGLEYYIDATDGIAHTYKGSAEAPYQVTVQVAVSGSDLGDVDGNGAIEIKDAMMLLMAINDRLNLTEEQFARADIDGNGELAAKEALRIIQYVNGSITSILM